MVQLWGTKYHSRIFMSKVIALTNAEGRHIGFMLLAGVDEGYRNKTGEWRGDCVFIALPKEPDLLNDSAFLELVERKQRGEHSVRVANDGKIATFDVADAGLLCFYAAIGSDGGGEWGSINAGTRTKSGRAIFAR